MKVNIDDIKYIKDIDMAIEKISTNKLYDPIIEDMDVYNILYKNLVS